MNFLTFFIIYLSIGFTFLILILIDFDTVINPMLKSMITLKKFVDRNQGIIKTERDYHIDGTSPVSNMKQLIPPENNLAKFVFYVLISLKIILFYWIIYFLIIFCGEILLKINPKLND